MVRSVFRVAEYVQGHDGYLLSTEVFLYIFDAVPMLFVVLWLCWKHPSEISLLLRGQPVYQSGFKLLSVNLWHTKFSTTV